MYSASDGAPDTVVQAIIYADAVCKEDSAWSAFVSGWALGSGMMLEREIENLLKGGRAHVVSWAEKKNRGN